MSNGMKQLVKQLTADKKKLSLMLCLLAFGLLLWGRFLMNKVPRTAVAEPGVVVASVPSIVSPGEAIATRRSVQLSLYRTLDRNVFDLDARGYPRIPKDDVDIQVQEKSVGKPVDESERAKAVREATRGLTLQSTMLGARPRAIISGRVLYAGDRLNGFVLSSIHARHVIVEKDGVQVRVGM